MSENQSTFHTSNEIVIVKKRGGDHGGHHGGAWKIAYADFMTAMMAFFLVMWLVNASNDETRAAVASYFNPIRLTDNKPATRGLRELDQSTQGSVVGNNQGSSDGVGFSAGPQSGGGDDPDSSTGKVSEFSDADYFENPYSVLAEIALETGQQTNVSAAGEGGASTAGPATGASGGEAYRDPFDPDFWSKAVEIKAGAEEEGEGSLEALANSGSREAIEEALAAGREEEAERQAAETAPETTAEEQSAKESVAEMAEKVGGDSSAAAAANGEALTAELIKATKLREQLESSLTGRNVQLGEGMSVELAEGGLMISLTGELKGGMFNVGSAVPKRDMVLAMEEIGKLLSEQDGSVSIRGHTDARPFAGTEEDNWTLSMDRARSAYFMLVRGGLAEDRIEQVSGFADRRLKVKDRPFDDANRRIEILIQTPAG
ncbi:MAG: MotB family protein [Alphaproteobacteria bacterium]|nr:MotB family protein [Alphaproteobacteria bacterium]